MTSIVKSKKVMQHVDPIKRKGGEVTVREQMKKI